VDSTFSTFLESSIQLNNFVFREVIPTEFADRRLTVVRPSHWFNGFQSFPIIWTPHVPSFPSLSVCALLSDWRNCPMTSWNYWDFLLFHMVKRIVAVQYANIDLSLACKTDVCINSFHGDIPQSGSLS
jgi:hypothetical protein